LGPVFGTEGFDAGEEIVCLEGVGGVHVAGEEDDGGSLSEL
jgi:hypothetical protein